MFKMFFGIYMIMVFDPQILFNDGFYDLIDVRIPAGIAAEARVPGRAVVSHPCAGPDLRRPGRAARPEAIRNSCAPPVSPIVAALDVSRGIDKNGEWYPAVSRSASAASPAGRSATGPTATRCGPASPTCRTSSSERYFPLRDRDAMRPSPTAAAPACTAAATASDRLPLPRAGRDLDPRRSLAHLSLGRERRTAGRPQPQDVAA